MYPIIVQKIFYTFVVLNFLIELAKIGGFTVIFVRSGSRLNGATKRVYRVKFNLLLHEKLKGYYV